MYQRTLPAVDLLATLHVDDPQCEPLLQTLREGLTAMEGYTEQMVNMLYEVDVYMAPSTTKSAAGFNPQEALAHVSDLFHVRCVLWQADVRATKPSFCRSANCWPTILVKKFCLSSFRHSGAHWTRCTKAESRKWTTLRIF